MKIIARIKDWYKEYAITCELIAEQLVKELHVKPNSVIVDLGCGTGAFTIPLALVAKESKIIAVDIHQKSLNQLNSSIKRFKVRNIFTIKDDVRKLSKIEDNSVDFVFSHWLLGVITNYSDLKRIFKESYRILKKGGVVAHSESYPIPKNKAQELYMKADIFAYHTRWWGIKEVRGIMKAVGFRKICSKYINFNLKIDPKISIPLIREWQKMEYFFTKKMEAIKNVELDSFLSSHKAQIEKYGLEFPTEYIVFAIK